MSKISLYTFNVNQRIELKFKKLKKMNFKYNSTKYSTATLIADNKTPRSKIKYKTNLFDRKSINKFSDFLTVFDNVSKKQLEKR